MKRTSVLWNGAAPPPLVEIRQRYERRSRVYGGVAPPRTHYGESITTLNVFSACGTASRQGTTQWKVPAILSDMSYGCWRVRLYS